MSSKSPETAKLLATWRDEVFQGAAEPVEFGDHELVVGPVGCEQCLVEFGAAGECAGGRLAFRGCR
jgi:hypothetical protein